MAIYKVTVVKIIGKILLSTSVLLLITLSALGVSALERAISYQTYGTIEYNSYLFSHFGFNIALPFLHESDESFVPNPSSTPSSWDLLAQIKPKEILLMTWGRNVFDMFAIGPDQVVDNLANYLDIYARMGYRLILPTGDDGFMCKELEYDLDTVISNGISNKRIIDVLAGDNHLGRNFLTDPTLDHLTIFREDDLSKPNYERRAIELLDYIRSKGGKASYHNPRWGDQWSIESGSRDRISVFNTHEDYFMMNIYRVWNTVDKALTEGRPEVIYNETYNSYVFALNFLKSKAGNIPLSNIGSEEDGEFHGRYSGYHDVTPEQAAEAERAMLDAFKDSGCGVIFKWTFFDQNSSAFGVCATNLSGINDPEWKLAPCEFYPSAEVWRQAFAK
jgi:hypothetical protein